MTSEPSIHDQVHAFADGELAEAEAELFRAHLAGCAACQAELRDIMMLAAVTQPLAAAGAGERAAARAGEQAAAGAGERATAGAGDRAAALPPVIPLASRRRRTLIAATATMAAAAALLLAWKLTRPEPIVLAQADHRPLEARLSYGAADRWRPYGVERAAGPAREEVRVDTLAQLESRGEWRGLADGYLLGGELERAAEALARAGDSADAESDRAALALQAHDAATALTHATRALALAPGHAQAAWNRALALRDLGLARTAASAFEAIAAKGERGWSDEAKRRAKELREGERESERAQSVADAAGRAMVASGTPPPAEIVRAHPELVQHYLDEALRAPKKVPHLSSLVPVAEVVDPDGRAGLAARVRAAATAASGVAPHEPADDPWLGVSRMLEGATHALQSGDAVAAERQARQGLDAARRADVDPRDLPRRFLVLLADAARARGQGALADAYVDEARLLMPSR